MKIDMRYYIKGMIEDFPYRLTKNNKCPWSERLFKVNEKDAPLDERRKEIFHSFVMKTMFLSKRARPDVEPAVSFLCTRTTAPNEGDWKKLLRMLSFLNGTIDDVLTLSADELGVFYCYIDSAFAVHPDMKSHTGSILTMGYGAALSGSTKQKVNSRSSQKQN